MSPQPYFYGLEPRWWTPDRLYRLYATPTGLAGAYVAGQFYDEQQINQQLALFVWCGWPFHSYVHNTIQERRRREEHYDQLIPGSASFLGHDQRNFRLNAADVERVLLRTERHWWTGPSTNNGSVEIVGWDGQTRRFLLVGDQPLVDITSLLTRCFGAVELADKVQSDMQTYDFH